MKRKIILVSSLATLALGLAAAPASAFTACNNEGDCWHTEARIHIPGVSLSFHSDEWGNAHRDSVHYHWHDSDAAHDWHQGYWSHGRWHAT